MNTTARRHEDLPRPGPVRPRSWWCGTALLALSGWLSLATPGTAAMIYVVPTDLNPGDQYRLAFVTSNTRNATSSNIDDYNMFVTTTANNQSRLAALGTTWTAIASTFTVDAKVNTHTNPDTDGPGVPIYLLNNTRLADDNNDLWNGDIQHPLAITETGDVLPDRFVWTGTYIDGTQYEPLGFNRGAGGATSHNDFGWIVIDFRPTVVSSQLYSISGVLEVPDQTAVPEPSSLMLCLVGLAGVLGLRYRQRPRRASATT
jgi:hypothetical protein